MPDNFVGELREKLIPDAEVWRDEMDERLTDPLTNIFNRRGFLERCDALLRLEKRRQEPVAIILIDVNNFKEFNDAFGHRLGDKVLVAVAQAMKKKLRDSDVKARWGGDEFIAFLPNFAPEDKKLEEEKIRKELEGYVRDDLPQALPRETVGLTIGISYWNGRESLEDLIDRADKDMYKHKNE